MLTRGEDYAHQRLELDRTVSLRAVATIALP
jgi:hypothetical protein